MNNKMNHMSVSPTKRRNRILTIATLVILLAVMILADQEIIFTAYVRRIIKLSAAYGIAALSMTLIQGFTGLFSLGQAGFNRRLYGGVGHDPDRYKVRSLLRKAGLRLGRKSKSPVPRRPAAGCAYCRIFCLAGWFPCSAA